ncbi:AMP-binding protein [Skermania piniformis]
MVSDVINFGTTVDQSRGEMYRILRDPSNYPRFFRGIGGCTRFGEPDSHQFTVTTRRGSVRFGLEVRDDDAEIVLEGIDTDWIGSIRLTEPRVGHTRISATLFKVANIQRWLSLVANNEVSSWARDGIRAIADYLGGTPNAVLSDTDDPRSRQLAIARTMIDAEVVHARRPDRALRQLELLARWGFDLPGGSFSAAAQSPRDIAVVDDGGTRTYAELQERTNRLAAGLARLGIGSDQAVGILARNRAATVEAILAVSELGADTLLLDTDWDAARIARVATDFPLAAVFVDEAFEPALADLPAGVIRIATLPNATADATAVLDELVATGTGSFPEPTARGRKVMFSSGVGATYRSPPPRGFGVVAAPLSRLPLRAGDRILLEVPLSGYWGMTALRLAIPLRTRLVLHEQFEPEACLSAIERHRCTALFVAPAMLEQIVELPAGVRSRYDLTSLRIIASSGGPLLGDLPTRAMDTFGDILYNLYGTTETGWATIAGPADLRLSPGTAGRIVLGSSVAIRDGNGVTLPRGAVGRIVVDNQALLDGYPAEELPAPAGAYVDTGDLGFVDADDLLFVTGRRDETVLVAGQVLALGPLTNELARLPEVRDVATVALPDARIRAFLVRREGAELTADEVWQRVESPIDRDLVPIEIVFVDQLPRSAMGRVRTAALPTG